MQEQTEIYLIRHGEVDNPNAIIYGRTDLPLTQKGRQQLETLALNLERSGVIPTAIFSSPLQRTKDSAAEISEIFPDIPVIYDDNLLEVDVGEMLGKPAEEQHNIGDIYNSPLAKDMHVETPEHITERMNQVIKRVLIEYPSKTVFIVGHKDTFEFLIWELNNPSRPRASILEIEEKYLLEKGEAWKFIINDQGEIIESTRVNFK